jgi:aminoglycoside phosphotransferase (APT) family kinase protein
MHIPLQVQAAWINNFSSAQFVAIPTGLSNSSVWQVSTNAAQYCLKAWPKSAHLLERLTAIHQWLAALGPQLDFVPRLILHRDQGTLLCCNDHLWECASWQPGTPVEPGKLTWEQSLTAVSAVAQMHRVSASYHQQQASSPSVETRMQLISHYQHRQEFQQPNLSRASEPISGIVVPSLSNTQFRDSPLSNSRGSSTVFSENELAKLTLHYFQCMSDQVTQQLKQLRAPIQLCWVARDLHYEHLLFDHERLTGVIDYGAARIDEPLIDLVRLLGSLWPHDAELRHRLVDHYRSLMDFEVSTVRFQYLDHASTLLSAMQWLQWLLIDRREFQVERQTLLKRWAGLLERLQRDQW